MREVSRKLRQDESLLWESAPESFSLLEGKFCGRILAQWICTILFSFWLCYVERNRPEFGVGMKLLVAGVAAVIILAPIMEHYNLKKQKYYLTDQRALVRTVDGSWYYMDYTDIDECTVIRDVTRGACIAMGSTITGEVNRQLRWQACHPKIDLQETDRRGESLGIVFYQPEGVEKMIRIMKDHGVEMSAA